MRKGIARSLTITIAALAGCGHTTVGPTPAGAPASSPAATSGGGDSQIVVSADLGSPDLIALWSVYGVTLADAAEKIGRADYAGEVSARALLADRWKELRTEKQLEKQLHDPYLDRLAEVRDAGFIGEYVLAFLARPGWTVSGDELARLNAAAFKTWAAGHLPKDHHAVTAATVRLRGLPPAPVPGSHLPSTTDVNPAETPCANLQPAIDRAVADWDREARALPSVPLSIELAEQTLPSLDRLSRDPRARRDGVVFVSPAALEILFDAGFCAVDRSDWPTAEKMLRRAVELSPANANVRGELVQTLIMQKRPDEADGQLEIALAFSDSPCQTAMLWRKRAYILFDRGKLVDSYRAYAHSLEFDPQSELARSEMNLIVTTLQRAGTYDEKVLAPLVAPASGKMHVTNCPR
ncbi:MAG TPA: tetratricopeptide repeat protein [Polyangia bacterium]|nr:tetratricopeptide repeat protein [Polyangia bacterium]